MVPSKNAANRGRWGFVMVGVSAVSEDPEVQIDQPVGRLGADHGRRKGLLGREMADRLPELHTVGIAAMVP